MAEILPPPPFESNQLRYRLRPEHLGDFAKGYTASGLGEIATKDRGFIIPPPTYAMLMIRLLMVAAAKDLIDTISTGDMAESLKVVSPAPKA